MPKVSAALLLATEIMCSLAIYLSLFPLLVLADFELRVAFMAYLVGTGDPILTLIFPVDSESHTLPAVIRCL